MSLDFSPKESLISRGSHTTITLSLKNSTPLLKLSQVLPWDAIYQLIRPDLEKSAGPYHHLGRKLHVEQHLKMLIIQGLYQLTDRAVAMQTRVRADFLLHCRRRGVVDSRPLSNMPVPQSYICRDLIPIECACSEDHCRARPDRLYLDGPGLNGSGSQYGLSVRRHFDAKACLQDGESDQLSAVHRSPSGWQSQDQPRGYQHCQQSLFFSLKDCQHREDSRNLCQVPLNCFSGLKRSLAGNSEITRQLACENVLEHKAALRPSSRESLSVLERCGALYKNPQHQKDQNFIIPRVRGYLYHQGKTRKNKGVWKTVSSRADRAGFVL